jgi:hypothetical protein
MFYLQYVLGMRPPSNKKADKGNVVHKALEVLARVGMCRRDGLGTYQDETFGEVDINRATPDWALDRSYDYYARIAPHNDWSEADRRECRRWMHAALGYNEGQYDPRNLDVIEAEQRFDFTLPHPWARYEYRLGDEAISGQLGIKGTVDLVTRNRFDPRILHAVDWKTGSRKDWSKDGWEKKTYDEVRNDPQLCLYQYALRRLYPEASHVFFTIFYINDGGPYTVRFGPEHVAVAEEMIRRKFEEIRDAKVPILRVGRRCTTFCHFGKNASKDDPSRTICEFMKDEVKRHGIDRATQLHGRPGAYAEYGDGGGRRSE